MRIFSGGNVHIGTTPSSDNGARLQVSGYTDITANNSTAIHLVLRGRALDSVGQMEFWNNAKSTRYGYIATDSTSMGVVTTQSIPLVLGTNSTARLTIAASTGAATFSSSVTAVNAILSGTGSAFADGLRINRNSNSNQYTVINHLGGATNIVSVDQSGNNIAEIYFGRSINGSTISTSMVINGSGNVGIGTPNPTTFASYITTQISGPAGAGLLVESTTGTILGQFFADNGFPGGAAISFGSRTNNPVVFLTNNAEKMRITSGGNFLIGTDTDNGSKLRVNGSLALPHVTKSANYTLDASDYTVGFDCASNRTANLPDATTCAGRIYVIYQYNTNFANRSVTLDGNGSQTIDGVTTYNLIGADDFSSVMIQSNGSNWIVIADKLYYTS